MRLRKAGLLCGAALFFLSATAQAAPYDAPATGLPGAVQDHIDMAYLLLKGDVSARNLPSTLFAIAPKTYGDPPADSRKIASLPATKVFDQFYYLGTSYVSAWALNTSGGIIVFDTLNNDEEATQFIEGGLRKVGLDPKNIKYIVISHGHGDHFGGAKYLQEKYHARVLMSAVDWEIVGRQTAGGASRFGPPPKRDMDVTDGQKLTLGKTTVSLYLTPGHSPGTIAAIIPVTDRGRPHVLSFIGGTGMAQIDKDPSKGGFRILRESLGKFAKISVAAGADSLISCHPFLDDSWEKAKLVQDGKAGNASPWIVGKDAVLRYYAATIEAVNATETYYGLQLAKK